MWQGEWVPRLPLELMFVPQSNSHSLNHLLIPQLKSAIWMSCATSMNLLVWPTKQFGSRGSPRGSFCSQEEAAVWSEQPLETLRVAECTSTCPQTHKCGLFDGRTLPRLWFLFDPIQRQQTSPIRIIVIRRPLLPIHPGQTYPTVQESVQRLCMFHLCASRPSTPIQSMVLLCKLLKLLWFPVTICFLELARLDSTSMNGQSPGNKAYGNTNQINHHFSGTHSSAYSIILQQLGMARVGCNVMKHILPSSVDGNNSKWTPVVN